MTIGMSPASLDEAIGALAPEAFDFLFDLVAAPSTVGREASAQAVVAARLIADGFAVRELAIPETIVDDPIAGVPGQGYAGRFDLVGTREGASAGPTLLLDCHVDVVPAESPDLWTSPPFAPEVRDGWLYGRGAGDMKCGFAASLLAIRALDRARPGWQHGRLQFLSAIEEECTGNGTLAALRAGITPDAVLLPEPTDLKLLLGGIGILWFEVTILGRAAHAHLASEAVNPVDVALRLVDRLRDWEARLNRTPDDAALTGSPHPYNLNIGTLRAGDWPSSVPAMATIGFRLGFPRAWTPLEAESRVRAAVAAIAAEDPWLAARPPVVRLNGFRAEGYLLAEDHPLAAGVARAHEDAHGAAPEMSVLPSTTDARIFLNVAGIPSICYGPRTRSIHGVDEAVELASVVEAARTIARFLAGFLGVPVP